MEFIDAFDALTRDDAGSTLFVQPMTNVPDTLAVADDVVAAFAPLPPVPFVIDTNGLRLLADDVAVCTGTANLAGSDDKVHNLTISGVCVLSTGSQPGIVAFGPIGSDITFDPLRSAVALRLAVMTQTTNIGR